jgi:ammonium transporter, Amt family
MWGTLATGLFASTAINAAGHNGLVFGDVHTVLVQLVGIVVVAAFCFVGSYVLLRVINYFMPLRVGPEEERKGLDLAEFGESAYDPGGTVPPSEPEAADPG